MRTHAWAVTPRKPEMGRPQRTDRLEKTTRNTDRTAGPWEEGTDGEQSIVRTRTAGQVFSADSYHGQAA